MKACAAISRQRVIQSAVVPAPDGMCPLDILAPWVGVIMAMPQTHYCFPTTVFGLQIAD